MPTRSIRSTATRATAMASTGVPNTMIMLVAYIDQTKRGKRDQVIPGARMVCTVTMKLRPVRMDEKPAMKTATAAGTTMVLENIVLNGV